MKKRLDIAIGLLLDRRDDGLWIFVAKRKNDQALGGFWEFPGGKVETGESARECVVREFAEEVGLAVEPTEWLALIEHDYDHAHVRLHPFVCRLIAGEPRPIEVAACRWMRVSALDDSDFPPANAPLLQQVRAWGESD